MNKIFLVLLVSLMSISLVFAAQANAGTGQRSTDDGTQINTELQNLNRGAETQAQNQLRVQAGNYENSNGEQMQIQSENGFKLQVGGVESKSNLQIGSEYDPTKNKTMLKTQLSNGKNAEVKVMPNTASQTAIQRLQLKVCNSDNNCSIELKEVGSGEQAKLAYEVKAQKQAKILAMFKTKMQVQTQIDAETGETIQTKKPWWAFLASE